MGVQAKSVVVVGAGLGGISAAISLAQEGYAVTLLDKNDHVGGKLNQLEAEGYVFDLGPSILTLPHIFERLFERSGKRMEDYVKIRPVRPHWRCRFEDGTVVAMISIGDLVQAIIADQQEEIEHLEQYISG